MQNTAIYNKGISTVQGSSNFSASFNTLSLAGSNILLTHTHTHTHTHTRLTVGRSIFFNVRIRAREACRNPIVQRDSKEFLCTVFLCISGNKITTI